MPTPGTPRRTLSTARQFDVATRFGIKFELSAHAGESRDDGSSPLSSLKLEYRRSTGRRFRMAIKTTAFTPLRVSTSARQPCRTCADYRYPFVSLARARSYPGASPSQALLYGLMLALHRSPPMVTAPNSSCSVRSLRTGDPAGGARGHTSGRVLVWCDSSAAQKIRPSLASFSQFGM